MVAIKALTHMSHAIDDVALTTLILVATIMTDTKKLEKATHDGRQGKMIAKNRGNNIMIRERSEGIVLHISPGRHPHMKTKYVEGH